MKQIYIKKLYFNNKESKKKKIIECQKNLELYSKIINNNYDISELSEENIQMCKKNYKYFSKKANKESNIDMLNFINYINIQRTNIILIHPENF